MFEMATIQKKLDRLKLPYLVPGPNFVAAVSSGFSDTFNRANANLEASPTSSSGGTWTHDGAIAAGLQISSNAIRGNTTNTTGTAYSAGDQGSADHYVEFTAPVATQPTGSFFCCRMTDRNNFVGIRAGQGSLQGQIEVYRRVAGSLTLLHQSGANQAAQGDTIRLIVEGTNFRILKNGANQLSNTAIGDGGALTSQNTGIVARIATGVIGDNFATGRL